MMSGRNGSGGSGNGGSFGHNFALSEESQLHGTMTGGSGGRPLSSSGTSSTSATSSAAVAAVPVSMETTSSTGTTISTNSPSSGSSALVKATSYDSPSRLIAGYPRLPGFYGSTYSGEQSSLYPTNSAASFYPSLSTHYDLDKSTGNSWTPLASQTPYSAYDAAHHSFYSPYSNCYGAIDSAARRKNATRETTNTLKAWLYEHRKNPYPTKGEKIMLAIITKMTLTQVSTWFANARRRLKKENKMTWEPKNKGSDARDDSDKDSCKNMDDKSNDNGNGLRMGLKDETSEESTVSDTVAPLPLPTASTLIPKGHLLSNQSLNGSQPPPGSQLFADGDHLDQRPKIWSLAQTATSEASSLTGRLYPEWYAFQSNNVSPDNLLLGSFPDTYHHHHHHHSHPHQTGQHVQSPPNNFYSKGTTGSNQVNTHWNDESHIHLGGTRTTVNGNFACSPVPFLSEHGSQGTAPLPTVQHHFLLHQHRSAAQIPI